MANKDHDIDRYAHIRKSKLGGAEADLGVNPQEQWEDECWLRDDADAQATDAVPLLSRGYEAVVAAARDEAAAAGAGTVLRSDREFSTYSLETNATAGDLIRLFTERYFQQDRGPEVEARIRFGAGAAVMTSSRFEIGLYADLPAGTTRNSPVGYASIVRETGRGNDNFLLCAAGIDFQAFSIDDSPAAAAELTDETADAQEATANDVPLGVAAAQDVNDGLLVTNPRRFAALVLTMGTAETAMGTYIWQYWGTTATGAANAWVTFTPGGTVPAFTAGSGLGRKVMQIPAATQDLMRPFAAGDVLGTDATTANVPGGRSVIGQFGVRVRINPVGVGAPPLFSWLAVEEQADLGIGPTENAWHVVRLRVSNTAEPVVQARIDNAGFGTVGPGALDASTTRVLRLGAKLQTLAAEAKRLDIDYWRCFQDRAT